MTELYRERQRYNQWWLWMIIIAVNVMSIAVTWKSIVGHPSNYIHLIPIVFSVLILVFFFLINLETRISEEGIAVRFFPFHLSFISIHWKDVVSAELRTYSPLGEYGGWGIRYGFSGAGKAYNVSGNKGIQLLLKDGSKLLIGTNKAEEVERVLKRLNS